MPASEPGAVMRLFGTRAFWPCPRERRTETQDSCDPGVAHASDFVGCGFVEPIMRFGDAGLGRCFDGDISTAFPVLQN